MVPPGGAGLYYFSLYYIGDAAEFNVLEIHVAGRRVCSGDGNAEGSTHFPTGTCSAVVRLVEGKGTKHGGEAGWGRSPGGT